MSETPDDIDDFLSLLGVAPKQTPKVSFEPDPEEGPEAFLAGLETHRGSEKWEPVLPIVEGIEHLIDLAQPLEAAAQEAGIPSVFDDGGFRTLLVCRLFGLQALPGKAGHDARCPKGRNFELKTVNLVGTHGQRRVNPGVTTEHTLRQANIERFRRTNSWLIGVFAGCRPLEFWQVPTGRLETFFSEWEQKLAQAPNQEINNPKIPLKFIRETGHLVWSPSV